MTHDDARAVLGLYALRAAPTSDAAALVAHLTGCAACVADLAALEETAAALARAVEPVTPSAAVTHRILAAVGPTGRSHRVVRMAGGFAAAAAVLLGVVSYVGLDRRLDRALTMLGRGRDLLQFMASPDVVTIPLAATDAAPAARALVAYDRRSGRVMLVAYHLPSPPAGQVYQLWAIGDDVRASVAFTPGTAEGMLRDDRGRPGRPEVPLFAITLEPAAGGTEPTGQFVLRSTSTPAPRG